MTTAARGTLRYRVMAAGGVALIRTFEAAVKTVAGNRVYYDTREFPWVARVEERWREVRDELDSVLGDRRPIPNFEDVSEEQKRIVQPGVWKSYLFFAYGQRVAENCARCPRTIEILETIPGVATAMFSVLRPGARLSPHRGPFKGVLRYHLGLRVPAGPPSCAIRVGGEVQGWEEGKSLVFDDTHEHEAWNESAEVRVVLFVDFVRDLPFPIGLANRGMVRLIGSSPFVQNLIDNVNRANGRAMDVDVGS